MASALLFSHILTHSGLSSKIVYSGDVHDYQNKQIVTDLDFRNLMIKTKDIDTSPIYPKLEEYLKTIKYSVVVDTENPENQVSYSNYLNPFAIIDHHEHTNHKTSGVNTLKLFKKSGACVSILIDYLKNKGYSLESEELSSLRIISYLGLKTDTLNFDRKKMTPVDEQAKNYLVEFLTDQDYTTIDNIENPLLPRETLKAYSRAMVEILEGNHLLADRLVLYEVPEIIKKDVSLVSYLANRLYEERKQLKANSVIVYGLVDTSEIGERKIEVIASGRSDDSSLDVREVFDATFYHTLPDGKRLQFGGGRKTQGTTTAGATGILREYLEYNDEEMKAAWQLQSKLYERRICKALGISATNKE